MKIFQKKSVFFATIAVAFFALLLIIFKEFAFDSNNLMLNSDQLNGIGSRILRAENVVLTEWDDSRLGGIPTIDALFADAYHPLVWVQFLTDPARAVGFKFILTLWVAFCSAMLLAWNLTGNKWWASLLGFLYALSPEFFSYIYGGHDGKMMVFAIAPLALLAIRKIVRNGSLGYLVVLALSITWMILGSHLQLTYLFLWGAGFYTLYEIASNAQGIATRGKRLGLAAVALGLGLALASFQLLPPYLYTTTQSVRGSDEKTNYGHAVSWSLHQEEMASMLLPGFVGVDVYEQDEKTGDLKGSSFVNVTMEEYRGMAQAGSQRSPFYWGHNSFKLDHNNAGALLTFLGFLCLFLPGMRRYAAFWGLGAVVALSYGMGDHSPLFKLWYSILPGVKNFRAPGMALFWLPLLLVMMAGPVLKTVTEDFEKNKKPLLHGTALYAILLALVLVARFAWTTFIGPVGLVVILIYAMACLGVMSLDDMGKKLTVANFVDAFKGGLPGTSRMAQVSVLIGFALIGVFMMSGQNLLNDPVTAPYFYPLNEVVMNATASKAVPSFILVLVTIVAAWSILKWKGELGYKAVALVILAGIELFFIDGAFIQNVKANEYLQPTNAVIQAIKAPYKADSLNTPRVLAISRNKALSGNAFPQYHLRNADGFHDNELSSYRNFRGGQNNANYLMNINNPEAAHPFLDLMNIGAIIFDTQRGTSFMPNPTAMGEAFLYGEAVVMNDDEAIETLKKGAIRKPKPEAVVEDSSAAVATELEAPSENSNEFYYKEKIILDQEPSQAGDGGIPQGFAKLVKSPKMDTQVFSVESDRKGFMLVSGNYHPYWRATVNGVDAKVYKAFGTLRAVEIPKGKSEVVMEYRSVPFHNCIKVSLVALIALGAIGVLAVVKGSKKAKS
ncbi:MAG: hypothetical protein HUK21_05890 [Fibrobacteraceae bacterium]|nr:hypothetical protein [Fibrobacteraceae bacterium]